MHVTSSCFNVTLCVFIHLNVLVRYLLRYMCRGFFADIFRLMFYSEEGLTEQAVPCRISRLCLCIVADLLA